MRLLVDLVAQADAAPDTNYHDKIRGRIWRSLRGTKFDDEHGNGKPLGFSYSNIFPWGSMTAGDKRQFLLASTREDLLAAIAKDFRDNREFNIGDRPFEIEDLRALDVDVGEPGTRGVIETATGVVVRLYDHHREEYGIDGEGHDGTPTYWQPEHTIEPFRDAIVDNLQEKHDRFAPEYRPGPAEVDGSLFEGYDFLKTYALPVTVTTGTEIEIVVSKWRFDYRVRNDTHRHHLNLALNTGIGGRNGLGFGFVNIVEKTTPDRSELEGENAFA
ncbi:CRISPR-associated endoribonuclease Cas6 [Haladaptatus cibarius]|uniref:CRISPR-associated endoribonuclease Cas6 n=1 Tax=Haladaptatus cibarius TaxID=453847 RepID=UPI000678732F|nr:CRISPR-associated endoribonuclease Cas6 [Haladaptatus cibarius]